jgi:ankyrin repeat protein
MNREMLMRFIACVLLYLGVILSATTVRADAIIANHYSVGEFNIIPDSFIQAIGEDYLIFYGHTSHGSQIVTGLNILFEEDTLYYPPDFNEYGDDLGGYGDTTWVPPTRDFLNTNPNYNLVMWSWCGGVSDNTEEGINIYLNAMNQLEQDYPNVKFVYMTGHLDGSGPSGNLYARNNQIRAYCTANNKTLFDFADIESYDPDGSYYPDASDACEWCETWCSAHPCPSCPDCAHSHCFNCYEKGKAWWWMMAKISGWNSTQDSIPHVVSTSPTQNQLNVPINANISVTFNTPMDTSTINDSTFVVNAWSTGLHTGSISYNALTKTATLNPDSDFVVGEIVTVVLTTGIKSSVGTPMESSYVWCFTTKTDDGAGCFAPEANYGVGDEPYSVFCADLDGDGDLDLAVANFDSDNVSILKNNGNGTFQTKVDYGAGDSPASVFCADLDGDGDLDLAVVNHYGNNISILKNNGDGTYQTAVNYATDDGPRSVFCADLDGDTDLDIAVANNNSNNVSIFTNNGDGTFQDAVNYGAGVWPSSVFCADLDRDADLDLAVSSGRNYVSILKNNGDGTFQSRISYEAGNGLYCLFCADLDGDNDVDLATANWESSNVSILKNNGDGTFQSAINYGAGNSPYFVFCANLDGDTDLDIAVVNNNDNNVSILTNNGDGTFQDAVNYGVGPYPLSVFCADLDGDGDLDLATSNIISNNVSILLNIHRGDCNKSGLVELGDVVYLITYLYKSGPAPVPLLEGDVNCDGVVELGDVVYLITYLYKAGPAPCC